jgi:hypothetical protein
MPDHARRLNLEEALTELEQRGVEIERATEYPVTASPTLAVTILEQTEANEPRFRWTDVGVQDDGLPLRGTQSFASLQDCLEQAFAERFDEAVRIIGD